MSWRGGLAVAVAVAALVAPAAASALSLDEAIALAAKANPDLAQSRAQADAAAARVTQARAGFLPSVSVMADAGSGTTDLGGFFGFGEADVKPRSAAIELRQPLFSGGATLAAFDQARAGRDAARAQAGGAQALLSARVADAYVGVLSGRELLALNQAQVERMVEAGRQAQLRFERGEIPRTDVNQAEARLAEARAGLARAQGAVARGRAHFLAVTGVEPEALEPLPDGPAPPASLDEAVAEALRASPALVAAQAGLRAAEAGARYAEAGRLPSVALTATASTVRDKFFPGYQADDVTVGVQGRWTLFAGGAIGGKVAEAKAGVRAARAARDGAEANVREAVISAWSDLAAAKAVLKAATAQTAAASSALDDVRQEVRVGQKPTLDLLDAQRDLLAAQSAAVAARGEAVVAAYRLQALLRGA